MYRLTPDNTQPPDSYIPSRSHSNISLVIRANGGFHYSVNKRNPQTPDVNVLNNLMKQFWDLSQQQPSNLFNYNGTDVYKTRQGDFSSRSYFQLRGTSPPISLVVDNRTGECHLSQNNQTYTGNNYSTLLTYYGDQYIAWKKTINQSHQNNQRPQFNYQNNSQQQRQNYQSSQQNQQQQFNPQTPQGNQQSNFQQQRPLFNNNQTQQSQQYSPPQNNFGQGTGENNPQFQNNNNYQQQPQQNQKGELLLNHIKDGVENNQSYSYFTSTIRPCDIKVNNTTKEVFIRELDGNKVWQSIQNFPNRRLAIQILDDLKTVGAFNSQTQKLNNPSQQSQQSNQSSQQNQQQQLNQQPQQSNQQNNMQQPPQQNNPSFQQNQQRQFNQQPPQGNQQNNMQQQQPQFKQQTNLQQQQENPPAFNPEYDSPQDSSIPAESEIEGMQSQPKVNVSSHQPSQQPSLTNVPNLQQQQENPPAFNPGYDWSENSSITPKSEIERMQSQPKVNVSSHQPSQQPSLTNVTNLQQSPPQNNQSPQQSNNQPLPSQQHSPQQNNVIRENDKNNEKQYPSVLEQLNQMFPASKEDHPSIFQQSNNAPVNNSQQNLPSQLSKQSTQQQDNIINNSENNQKSSNNNQPPVQKPLSEEQEKVQKIFPIDNALNGTPYKDGDYNLNKKILLNEIAQKIQSSSTGDELQKNIADYLVVAMQKTKGLKNSSLTTTTGNECLKKLSQVGFTSLAKIFPAIFAGVDNTSYKSYATLADNLNKSGLTGTKGQDNKNTHDLQKIWRGKNDPPIEEKDITITKQF